MFIITVFFYTMYNLNEIHISQNQTQDQIRKAEQLNNEKSSEYLAQNIEDLKDKLNQEEKRKNEFIDTIKLELVLLVFVAFLLSYIISMKIIKEIQEMLDKLNNGILQLFNNDENTIQVDLGNNNELSLITDNFNLYLEKQKEIIHSREELLRNISHELKTPITKGKFLLEKIKDDQKIETINSINNVFTDIEALTNKLLQKGKTQFCHFESLAFQSQ